MPQPAARVADVIHVQSAQLQALQVRREMLSSQYQQALAERGHISQERMNAQARGDTKMVQEFDATIDRLSARIRQLEKNVSDADRAVDEAMKNAPITTEEIAPPPPSPEAITLVPPPFGLSPVDFEAQRLQFQRFMAAEAVGLVLLGAILYRFGIARGKRLAARVAPQPTESAHAERMQQAVDAIAIEVERLSEGQRFINNLLSTRRPEREALPVTPKKVSTPSDGTRITPH